MDSQQTFIDDQGNVFHGADAIAAAGALIDTQQKLREQFKREHPKQWARAVKLQAEAGKRFENDPRRKQKVAEFQEARRRGEAASLDLSAEWSRAARAAHAPEGRAPRAATNQRSRSRRGERSSSLSSDDPDPEPEPHRVCGWCGVSIKQAGAELCSHTHQVSWLRHRERAQREAVGDYLLNGPPPPLKPCSCGGAVYLDPEGDRVCMACGRWLNPGRLRSRNGHEVWLAEWTAYMLRDYGKPRPIPQRPWRDWQRKRDAQDRTYFISTETTAAGGRRR